MIVVFDTSVWISALQFGGRFNTPMRAAEKALRWNTLATSAEINAEILRVLVERFRWFSDDAHKLVGAYMKKAIHVRLTGNLRVCRDPNDDMVLGCAVVAGADCIVTGDKNLLVLDPYDGSRIVTPAEFLALDL